MKQNLIIFIGLCLLLFTYNCENNQEYLTSNSDNNQNNQLSTSIKQQNNYYIAKIGDTLVIPCEIENRKQATVIWQYSRSRIPETLAIGYFYFRKDFRIRVIANSSNEKDQSWNLEIRRVRLEDEGYYLCKVMTESESLKRVVYLKVEIEMNIIPVNPIVDYKESLSIFCNTSFVLNESNNNNKVAKSSHNNNNNNINNHKLVWYKDGINLSLNDNRHNNTTSLNYRIDHYTKPKLSSKLRITSFNPANIGVYTCKFKHQNVSTVVTSKNYLNKQLLDYDSVNAFSSSGAYKKDLNFFIYLLFNVLALNFLI